MISTVKLKRRVANASIFSIILSKLYHRQKLYLVILLEVDKNSKVGFYCAVLSLDLAVHL